MKQIFRLRSKRGRGHWQTWLVVKGAAAMAWQRRLAVPWVALVVLRCLFLVRPRWLVRVAVGRCWCHQWSAALEPSSVPASVPAPRTKTPFREPPCPSSSVLLGLSFASHPPPSALHTAPSFWAGAGSRPPCTKRLAWIRGAKGLAPALVHQAYEPCPVQAS